MSSSQPAVDPQDHRDLCPDQIVDLVEAAIAGAVDLGTSGRLPIDAADLADAVALYRQAGRAALRRRQEQQWFTARVELANWACAEETFATHVAPQLDLLDAGRAAWWFLRKYPCWRLRVRTSNHRAVGALLDALSARQVIAGWSPGLYEPEMTAFGGPIAMGIVHDLFCADSREVLAYSQLLDAPVGRRELSLLLVRALQQAAGLDWFESADVFDRLAKMRPASDIDPGQTAELAASMLPLLALTDGDASRLFSSRGELAKASGWRSAFAEAGTQLGVAAAAGQLDRGLRAVIAHIVIFHWNRLGLSGRSQAALARAAVAAMFAESP